MAGLGLFLLRVITALTFGYISYCVQQRPELALFSLQNLVGVLLSLAGVLMIFGFATMISGVLACAFLLMLFFSLPTPSSNLLAMAAGLSLVLVLVGPGAYSLDARFFGLRRIELGRHTLNPKP